MVKDAMIVVPFISSLELLLDIWWSFGDRSIVGISQTTMLRS